MGNVSANTETLICVFDCNGDANTVAPPHPVFMGVSGGTVTQLNLIEIGGQNGLNA